MPSKPKPKPLPAPLEAFLGILEQQAKEGADLDRVGALRQVLKDYDVLIDLDAELRENETFAERFGAIWRMVTLGMEDAQVNLVRKGKASAAPFLRNQGAITGPGATRGGNGRLVLERSHQAKVEQHRKGW